METVRPVFIIGNPRSGTTMLYHLMAANPGYAYPDFGFNGLLSHRIFSKLDKIYAPAVLLRRVHRIFLPEKGQLDYEKGLRLLNLDPYIPFEGKFIWKRPFKENGLTFHDATADDVRTEPTVARLVRKRYDMLMKCFGRKSFVDKCPDYTHKIDVINEIFPDAYFVNIIRDGRAVINSIAYRFRYRKNPDGSSHAGGLKWWGFPPENWQALVDEPLVVKIAHQWNYNISLASKAAEKLGERYYEVKYEDVVANTKDEMSGIFSAVGACDFNIDLYPETMENRNYKWQTSDRQKFKDSYFTKSNALQGEDFEHLEIIRPELERLGYLEPGEDIRS